MLLRSLCSLVLVMVLGCVVPDYKPSPTPVPEVTVSSVSKAIKIYAKGASQVFRDAAEEVKTTKDLAALHGRLQQALSEAQGKGFEGVDERLEQVLGTENPDLEAGSKLFLELSKEFEEISR